MYRHPLISLPFLLLLMVSCHTKESESPQENVPYCIPASLKESIRIERIQKRPVEQTMTLSGNIQYNQDHTYPFVSLIDGVVTATHFSLGDYVKKGQLLAEVKSSDLNELYDQMQTIKSQIQVAKRELVSVQSMYDDGLASQKELIESQSNLSVLQSNLKTTQENLALYSANGSKSTFQIKAPSEGYIVSKNINPGVSITAGDEALFTIANLDQVWIMANVYATSMRYVNTDQTVQITTIAYPDTVFKGKISNISQVFDEDERVLKARIVLDNTDGKLKPGMSADIILSMDSDQGEAIAIPTDAIIFDNNQKYVVVYKDDCHQEIRPLHTMAKNDLYVYTDRDFEENENVITTNELLIYEELNTRKN